MNDVVGIQKIVGKGNAAGLSRVRLICVSDVLFINANINTWRIPTGGIVLKKNNVVELQFSTGSSLTEEMVQSQFGDAWQCSIELYIPRDSPTRALAINSWRGKTFIALTKDKNGVMKVVGNRFQALRFIGCVWDTKMSMYKLVFSGQMKEPSFYTDSIDVFS